MRSSARFALILPLLLAACIPNMDRPAKQPLAVGADFRGAPKRRSLELRVQHALPRHLTPPRVDDTRLYRG